MSPARTALRSLPPQAGPDLRPDVQRLCAGEPVLDPDVDLIGFVNSDWAGLDADTDPSDYTLAEILLADLYRRAGIERRTNGDRTIDIASDLRRYLLPFAIETAARRPVADRGIARLRYAEVQELPQILAGEKPLPAATVAGDLLGRVGLASVWLSVADAGAVSHGGAFAVRQALADRRLPAHHDGAGRLAIAAVDLRQIGLLREPSSDDQARTGTHTHGLARSTARGVMGNLSLACEYAKNIGADVRPNFRALAAIEPLDANRQRPANGPAPLVTLAMTRAVCEDLHATFQLALWCLRLVGMRISELYGVTLDDLEKVDARWFMSITKQGGRTSVDRDEQGKLTETETKDHPKTPQSVRRVPLPLVLGALLERYLAIYHTDPSSGQLATGARLIVGLAGDDASGQGSLRKALNGSLARPHAGIGALARFHPHDMRAALITDLANAGVDKRLREMYAGHWKAQDSHDGYDRGATTADLLTVAESLDQILQTNSLQDLRVPTTHLEQFEDGTRLQPLRAHVRDGLRAQGWYVASFELPDGLKAEEVGQLLGVTPQTARRLMRTGRIQSQLIPWGHRQVWAATPAAVADYQQANAGTALAEVADELGLSYHQAYQLHRALADVPQPSGAPLQLDEQHVQAMRAEQARRSQVAQEIVDLQSAAQLLGLPLSLVQNQYRTGVLTAAPSPTGARRRYVTRASVQDALANRQPASVQAGEPLVPVAAARAALRLNRYQMSDLILAGIVPATTVNRRQCVTLSGAIAYADKLRLPRAAHDALNQAALTTSP